jgi:CBS-domain-containing membrane protein
LDDAVELRVADVVHRNFNALAAGATVAEVRAWFAASPHRRMALLADHGRFSGSLTLGDLDGEGDPHAPAARHAHAGPTVSPDAPAQLGYQIATRTDARRVPVVDAEGMLLGIVAITTDLTGFCGAS